MLAKHFKFKEKHISESKELDTLGKINNTMLLV